MRLLPGVTLRSTGGEVVFSAAPHLRRRLELLICLSMAAAVLLLSGDQPDRLRAIAIVFISAYAMLRYVRRYISASDQRRFAEARDARAQGVALALNTLRHHLGNKLVVTIGRAELLADDPRLPADLRQHTHTMLASAMAAAESIRTLDSNRGELRIDTSLSGPSLLELDPPTIASPLP